VHISELAQHHVENPREVVSQGDVVNVKIIEVDADRRRLSLSLKRVDESDDVQPRADGQPLETPAPPQIDLSEDVFPEGEAVTEAPVAQDEAPEPAAESTPAIPAAEPEETASDDDAEAGIEADAADPTHQGPGDSEGPAPDAPEEAEEPAEE
jgi:small subunit ribosomal protein S1